MSMSFADMSPWIRLDEALLAYITEVLEGNVAAEEQAIFEY